MNRGRMRRHGIGKMSKGLKTLAREIGEKNGMIPLAPGQRRPVDFYVTDHYSGKPIVKDRNAIIMDKKTR